jgi:hypothetical protein
MPKKSKFAEEAAEGIIQIVRTNLKWQGWASRFDEQWERVEPLLTRQVRDPRVKQHSAAANRECNEESRGKTSCCLLSAKPL